MTRDTLFPSITGNGFPDGNGDHEARKSPLVCGPRRSRGFGRGRAASTAHAGRISIARRERHGLPAQGCFDRHQLLVRGRTRPGKPADYRPRGLEGNHSEDKASGSCIGQTSTMGLDVAFERSGLGFVNAIDAADAYPVASTPGRWELTYFGNTFGMDSIPQGWYPINPTHTGANPGEPGGLFCIGNVTKPAGDSGNVIRMRSRRCRIATRQRRRSRPIETNHSRIAGRAPARSRRVRRKARAMGNRRSTTFSSSAGRPAPFSVPASPGRRARAIRSPMPVNGTSTTSPST